jgi:hypothetical protein
VAANSFACSGATSVTNPANSGIVTITFPATQAASGQDTPVTSFSLTGSVTVPVKGATPVTTAIDTTQYSGTVAWQTAYGAAHNGAFAASTVYQAVITLTAKSGYTFDGVGANRFTCSGATSVTNAANSGVVTIIFPMTAVPDTVSAFSLDGKVTAPVTGATPVATAIDHTQYTGTIAWQTSNGAAHTDVFAASTVYRAVITLTAKTGYTFDGVGANSFTYPGATSVRNAANSRVVTIIFPATADDTTIPIGNSSVKLYLDSGTVPLAQNGTTPVTGTGTFTVGIDTGSYSSIVWYLNGNPQTRFQGETSIVLSKQTAGTYLVTVEATPAGGAKQSGAHSFRVQ